MSKRFPEETMNRYDRWFQTPFGRRAAAMEKQVLVELLGSGEGRSLLDIGCGTGYFTEWVRDLGYYVTAVEPSEKMLSIARGRLGDDVPIRRMWAELLRFPSNSFDSALMLTSLEFTDDPARALREAMRVSRESVILGVLNCWHPLAAWRKLTSWLTGGTYRNATFFSARQLARMCRSAAGDEGKQASISWTGGVCLGQMILGRPLKIPAAAFIGMRADLPSPGSEDRTDEPE